MTVTISGTEDRSLNVIDRVTTQVAATLYCGEMDTAKE